MKLLDLTKPDLDALVEEQLRLPLGDGKAAFVKSEGAALRRWMDRHASEDFLGSGAVYSREYRCACGYRCQAPGDIWNHVERGCQA